MGFFVLYPILSPRQGSWHTQLHNTHPIQALPSTQGALATQRHRNSRSIFVVIRLLLSLMLNQKIIANSYKKPKTPFASVGGFRIWHYLPGTVLG
jgi:hypothetical protein